MSRNVSEVTREGGKENPRPDGIRFANTRLDLPAMTVS